MVVNFGKTLLYTLLELNKTAVNNSNSQFYIHPKLLILIE